MKRMLPLAFAAIVSFGAIGCGGGDEPVQETGQADHSQFEFSGEEGPSTTGGGNRAGAESAASED
jgi:hypothetical protein